MTALERPDFVKVIKALLRRRVVILIAVRSLLSRKELLISFFLLHLHAQVLLVCLVHATPLRLLELQSVVQLRHV